ncbi:MAG: DUF4280 domain-containing protein [Holosporales bacterium]|nr:DUF4280 domain-containing protein [Holosporales bacterium]
MAIAVCGATCQCSCGTSPSSLVVIPKSPLVLIANLPVGTIADFVPMVNLLPFGMCTTLTNPTVASATAAATAAALGVFTLTPMPCIPVILFPWITMKQTVTLPTGPVLPQDSRCQCAWGGTISITSPGQSVVI